MKNLIGRRGFLGLMTGALCAVGLDAMPSLGRVIKAVEQIHKDLTSFVVRAVYLFTPVRTAAVALRPDRAGGVRVLWRGSVAGSLRTSIDFKDGIVIEDGGGLEVLIVPLGEDLIRPALYVRNVRGRLVIEHPIPAAVGVSIEQYVQRVPRTPRITYKVEWAES